MLPKTSLPGLHAALVVAGLLALPTAAAHVANHTPALAYSGLGAGPAFTPCLGTEYSQSGTFGPEPIHGLVTPSALVWFGATKIVVECESPAGVDGTGLIQQEFSGSFVLDEPRPVVIGVDAQSIEDLAAYSGSAVGGSCSLSPPLASLPLAATYGTCSFYGRPEVGVTYHFHAVVNTLPGTAGNGFFLPGSGANPLAKASVGVLFPGPCLPAPVPPGVGCHTHGDTFSFQV